MAKKPLNLKYAIIILFSMLVTVNLGTGYAVTTSQGGEEQKTTSKEETDVGKKLDEQTQFKLNEQLFIAIKLDHARWADRLIEQGAELDARDEDGWTLLHQAALSGNIVNMEWLVEVYGFDVMARDDGEGTPAHAAALRGRVEAIVWLVNHGADVEETDDLGRTPRDIIRMHHASRLEELDARLAALRPAAAILQQNTTAPVEESASPDIFREREHGILDHPSWSYDKSNGHSF